MKARPIIFSGAMVRALLSGAKTQTRRVVKLPKGHHFAVNPDYPGQVIFDGRGDFHGYGFPVDELHCPYGRPGDQLWVRETWQGPLFDDAQFEDYIHGRSLTERPDHCVYAADGGPTPEFFDADDNLKCRWRPSIHMPRWASRITLEVTGVRVERLQDISADDAIAEGMSVDDAVYDYSRLWDRINGPGSWEKNPWVWVIEFRRAEMAT